LGRTDDPKKNT